MAVRMRPLELGWLGVDHELIVFPHPELILNVNRRTGQKHWLRGPILSYVIEHPDGLLLWDTGVSTEWPTEWLAPWLHLIDLTRSHPRSACSPGSRTRAWPPTTSGTSCRATCTPTHAGGLRVFQDAGAEIVVHEAEYRHVESLREPQRFWIPADFNLLHDIKPPTLVAGDEELMRGVRLIHVPGHTPGSMALHVELEQTGSVLLAGDALYTHESYGPPPAGSPMNPDPLGWAASVEKLRGIAPRARGPRPTRSQRDRDAAAP